MTAEERLKQMQALRDCLHYVLLDVIKAQLPLVALHLKIAISEAETLIEEENAKSANEARRARRSA